MSWQKKGQQRSEEFVAARPRKFTAESNGLRSETALTVPHGTLRYRSLSLELPCLFDSSCWRMTESSHPENQSHPVIGKDALRLHLSYSQKVHFLFLSSFPAFFPFICLVFGCLLDSSGWRSKPFWCSTCAHRWISAILWEAPQTTLISRGPLVIWGLFD